MPFHFSCLPGLFSKAPSIDTLFAGEASAPATSPDVKGSTPTCVPAEEVRARPQAHAAILAKGSRHGDTALLPQLASDQLKHLQAAHHTQRLLLDQTDDVLTVCSLAGQVLAQNRAAVHYAGARCGPAADPAHGRINYLEQLLQLEPELLTDLREALLHQREWSIIAHVPATLRTAWAPGQPHWEAARAPHSHTGPAVQATAAHVAAVQGLEAAPEVLRVAAAEPDTGAACSAAQPLCQAHGRAAAKALHQQVARRDSDEQLGRQQSTGFSLAARLLEAARGSSHGESYSRQASLHLRSATHTGAGGPAPQAPARQRYLSAGGYAGQEQQQQQQQSVQQPGIISVQEQAVPTLSPTALDSILVTIGGHESEDLELRSLEAAAPPASASGTPTRPASGTPTRRAGGAPAALSASEHLEVLISPWNSCTESRVVSSTPDVGTSLLYKPSSDLPSSPSAGAAIQLTTVQSEMLGAAAAQARGANNSTTANNRLRIPGAPTSRLAALMGSLPTPSNNVAACNTNMHSAMTHIWPGNGGGSYAGFLSASSNMTASMSGNLGKLQRAPTSTSQTGTLPPLYGGVLSSEQDASKIAAASSTWPSASHKLLTATSTGSRPSSSKQVEGLCVLEEEVGPICVTVVGKEPDWAPAQAMLSPRDAAPEMLHEAAVQYCTGRVGACWHKIKVTTELDPHTGQQVLGVAQVDVTSQLEFEARMGQVSDACVSLLELIFPRHVIEHMTVKRKPPQWGSDGRASGDERQRSMLNQLANKHPCVTLFFCDVVGFTSMSKEIEPAEVMCFLNDLYTQYDQLADKYGVYKVETVGDCYVVAGGLMEQDAQGFLVVNKAGDVSNSHAVAVYKFAQEVLQVASNKRMPHNGQPVSVRVGLHSGPVTSGVVGYRMPKFCLFGDSMNTASRMETTALPGSIHLSEATYDLLKAAGHDADLVCTGGVEVKGKGRMVTYLYTPRSEPQPGSGLQTHLSLQETTSSSQVMLAAMPPHSVSVAQASSSRPSWRESLAEMKRMPPVHEATMSETVFADVFAPPSSSACTFIEVASQALGGCSRNSMVLGPSSRASTVQSQGQGGPPRRRGSADVALHAVHSPVDVLLALAEVRHCHEPGARRSSAPFKTAPASRLRSTSSHFLLERSGAHATTHGNSSAPAPLAFNLSDSLPLPMPARSMPLYSLVSKTRASPQATRTLMSTTSGSHIPRPSKEASSIMAYSSADSWTGLPTSPATQHLLHQTGSPVGQRTQQQGASQPLLQVRRPPPKARASELLTKALQPGLSELRQHRMCVPGEHGVPRALKPAATERASHHRSPLRTMSFAGEAAGGLLSSHNSDSLMQHAPATQPTFASFSEQPPVGTQPGSADRQGARVPGAFSVMSSDGGGPHSAAFGSHLRGSGTENGSKAPEHKLTWLEKSCRLSKRAVTFTIKAPVGSGQPGVLEALARMRGGTDVSSEPF